MAKKRDKGWTQAGAARAAREARIATIRFLRTAPIGRMWQQGKMQLAHSQHLRSVGDPATATALLFGGMGYRPPFPGWAGAAELVLGDEARYLAEADLYILSPQMCDVVVAAAQTLTYDDLELLDKDGVPVHVRPVLDRREMAVRAHR